MTSQPKPARFSVQRLEPHGFQTLSDVENWEDVGDVIVDHGGHVDVDGAELDPHWPGWIVAKSPDLTVHSRKDGRWRVLEH